MSKALKAGDVVTVYERPYASEEPEGNAILVSRIMRWPGGAERWLVRFPPEIETYERTVLRAHRKPRPQKARGEK